jgi:hypothetical protein
MFALFIARMEQKEKKSAAFELGHKNENWTKLASEVGQTYYLNLYFFQSLHYNLQQNAFITEEIQKLWRLISHLPLQNPNNPNFSVLQPHQQPQPPVHLLYLNTPHFLLL